MRRLLTIEAAKLTSVDNYRWAVVTHSSHKATGHVLVAGRDSNVTVIMLSLVYSQHFNRAI
jgi:hypothetical protein